MNTFAPSRIRSLRSTGCALALALVGTLLAAGCRNDAKSDGASVAIPNVYDFSVDPAAVVADISPDRADVASAEAVRGQLEQGLLWHGISLVQVMRGAEAADPEVNAWTDQLTQNTLDLTAAIGLVAGPEAARAFHQQWSQHTQFLVDYSVAIGDDDQVTATAAVTALRQYSRDSGSFFATITNGGLNASQITELLDTHITNMIEMVDAAHQGQTYAAISGAMDDGAHLASIGHILSTAIVEQQPTAFPGSTETVAAALCTIVTTKSAAYLVGRVMSDNPNDPQVIDADQQLANAVGTPTEVYLGLDIVPIDGGAASVAAATRLAFDRASSTSSPRHNRTQAPG
ncbi:MAG: hypothetical protein ABIR32_02375 [Ilumatobacteraceae bacterium]